MTESNSLIGNKTKQYVQAGFLLADSSTLRNMSIKKTDLQIEEKSIMPSHDALVS